LSGPRGHRAFLKELLRKAALLACDEDAARADPGDGRAAGSALDQLLDSGNQLTACCSAARSRGAWRQRPGSVGFRACCLPCTPTKNCGPWSRRDGPALLHTEVMREHFVVHPDHWTLGGVLDFEPAMIGDAAYTSAARRLYLPWDAACSALTSRFMLDIRH